MDKMDLVAQVESTSLLEVFTQSDFDVRDIDGCNAEDRFWLNEVYNASYAARQAWSAFLVCAEEYYPEADCD